MDKEAFRQALMDYLRARIATAQSSHRAAVEAAEEQQERRKTDEGDGGPGSAYLAAGQAARYRGLRDDLQIVEALKLKSFSETDPVAVTAIVDVEDEDGDGRTLFVMPAGAGADLDANDAMVTVVTPHSPLGKAMMGKRVGDIFDFVVKGDSREYEVMALR